MCNPAQLGPNRLVVTYAYCPGSRGKTYAQLCGEGNEIAKGHGAVWSATPTVVQKEFTAKELPAAFALDVPTPKDRQPVYPRMLFVRREILAPGAKPLPLPEGAAEAKLRPGDTLRTLPNPFLIGAMPPPPPSRAPRRRRRSPFGPATP